MDYNEMLRQQVLEKDQRDQAQLRAQMEENKRNIDYNRKQEMGTQNLMVRKRKDDDLHHQHMKNANLEHHQQTLKLKMKLNEKYIIHADKITQQHSNQDQYRQEQQRLKNEELEQRVAKN